MITDKRMIQELVESIESKRKSKALKTVVPVKPKDKEKIKWDYALFLRKAIYNHVVYPEPEYSKQIEDSVKVSFCIDSNGTLIGKPVVSEIHSSRYENFNTQAIKAVLKASSKFPPLPEELQKESLVFSIPIVFKRN